MLATGQRRTEVGSLAWSEIDQAAGIWRLPPARTKANRAHEVPLSTLALSTIAEQPRLEGCTFVFSTRAAAPLGAWSQSKKKLDVLALAELRREGGEDAELPEWHLHDLRRSAATGMARLGVNRVVIGKILNHAEREVTAVYERHAYDAEKRAALQKRADR